MSWRQRALNAEHELKRAHGEIYTQRNQIGELLGRIRDLEYDLPPDGVQRVLAEYFKIMAEDNEDTKDFAEWEREVNALTERLRRFAPGSSP